MASTPKKAEKAAAHSAVADSILAAFIETLATEDGMTDTAARLKEALLLKRAYADADLRVALFGDETP